jgi:membrane protease YdiL (CAAX protease family)
VLSREVLLVLGLSLGMSAIYSVVSLIAKLTAAQALNEQTTALNRSPAPGRPLLSLVLELLGILLAIMPALLALHLLNRTSSAGTLLGLDRRRWRFDLLSGFSLALVIGVPGLLLYLAARALGINTIVAAANLTEWWAGPALVLAAFANGLLEEVVVVGYLLTRLRETGWGVAAAVTFSAVLRGTYHLYQGFGAFVGNAIMGVVFALFFLRTRRLWPLILAHTLLDIVAFLGYTLLRDHVSWL